MRLWKLDLILDYLENGKDSDLFKKVCMLSSEFPFRLEGIKMVRDPHRFLPIRGRFHPWQAFERPRASHKDPIEWALENLERLESEQ